MDKKAPLPKIASQTPTWHKVAALARKWQLTQFAGRLEEMALQPSRPRRWHRKSCEGSEPELQTEGARSL